jgi:trans-2-enoyl-CoA reductase
VIQLAKAMQVDTVNIIRDRPGVEELKRELMVLGATAVFTQEEFNSQKTREWLKTAKPMVLGLNCVGGRAATDMARSLSYVLIHGFVSSEAMAASW